MVSGLPCQSQMIGVFPQPGCSKPGLGTTFSARACAAPASTNSTAAITATLARTGHRMGVRIVRMSGPRGIEDEIGDGAVALVGGVGVVVAAQQRQAAERGVGVERVEQG